MASTTFTDNLTVIRASWLNDVNNTTYLLPLAGGAAMVGNTPAGNIAATTVQAALNELDAEKAKLAGGNTFAGAQTFQAATTFQAVSTFQADVTVPSINGGPLAGLRNRLINGDMRVDQRNGGAAVVPITANAYTVDRLLYAASQVGKFNFQQNANAAASVPGLPNYAGYVVASSFVPAAGDFFYTAQRIEGFNIADFAWGTASAKAVTLSFWAQSSVTGQHSGSLVNGAFSFSYPFTFTISAANTWTYITIPIPGPTTGTWTVTSALGLSVSINLGCGANFLGTAGAWAAANVFGVTGSVKVVSAANTSTFYLTGLQLELGPVATPFEQRPFGVESAMCQRYFQYLPPTVGRWQGTTTDLRLCATYPVTMRASPTAAVVGTMTVEEYLIAFRAVTAVSSGIASTTGFYGSLTTAAATAGNSAGVPPSVSTGGVALTAEL